MEGLYGRHLYVNIGIAFASFKNGKYEGQLSTDDVTPANTYKWLNGNWVQIDTGGEELVTIAGAPGVIETRFQQFNDGTNGKAGVALNSGIYIPLAANVMLWEFTAPSDGNYTRYEFTLSELAANTILYAVITVNPGTVGTAITKLTHDVDDDDSDQGCRMVFPGKTKTGRSNNITSFAVAVVGVGADEVTGVIGNLVVGQ